MRSPLHVSRGDWSCGWLHSSILQARTGLLYGFRPGYNPLCLPGARGFCKQGGIVLQDLNQGWMGAAQRFFAYVQGELVERMVGGEIALPTANSEPDVKVVPSSGSSVYSHL
jgi:hypothetical protein